MSRRSVSDIGRELDECDKLEILIKANSGGYSMGAIDALIGGIIERRGNLIHELRCMESNEESEV